MTSPFFGGEFRLTSKYGYRNLNGQSQFHSGIDLVGISSKQICAVASGIVVVSQIVSDKSNRTWEWGNYIAVAGDDGNIVYYCHMADRIAKVGERVSVGDIIGVEGNTGYSFGSHLHLEVRKDNVAINAADYIGIPNEVGIYKVEEKDIESRVEVLEQNVGEIYNDLSDVPEWAKPTIDKLIRSKVLKGDENGNLALSYQMIRMLVVLDRSGAFK